MWDAEKQAIGKITSGLTPGTLALKTIDFVYTRLPAWRDHSVRPNGQLEDTLNRQLCKFLEIQARNDFSMVSFQPEEYQSGQARVDISASPTETVIIGAAPYRTYTIYNPIVVFEGKRLPAPSRAREKEYVTGGTTYQRGGIQRFKLGIHGADHDIAAIVGYLQEGSPSDWHDKINHWIADLSNNTISDVCLWNTSEILGKLVEVPSEGVANCQSNHPRGGNVKSNQILIYHIWIVMRM